MIELDRLHDKYVHSTVRTYLSLRVKAGSGQSEKEAEAKKKKKRARPWDHPVLHPILWIFILPTFSSRMIHMCTVCVYTTL